MPSEYIKSPEGKFQKVLPNMDIDLAAEIEKRNRLQKQIDEIDIVINRAKSLGIDTENLL